MTSDISLPLETPIKRFLSRKNLKLEDIKLVNLIRFGTPQRASAVAQITVDRYHQLMNGHYLPESPTIIRKLAIAWDIDLVILTAIFERERI